MVAVWAMFDWPCGKYSRPTDFKQVSAQVILDKQGIALECGETLRLAPHTHGTDGFFAAVLGRVG